MSEGAANFPAILDKGLPLKNLQHSIGMADTVKLLTALIAQFVASFNVSKNMNAQQIQDLAFTLLDEYQSGSFYCPSYRLEDFAVFFERAKKGEFGRPFDYVDAALILEWLAKFDAERSQAMREEIQRREAEQEKRDREGKTFVAPERVKGLFEQLSAAMLAEEQKSAKEL